MRFTLTGLLLVGLLGTVAVAAMAAPKKTPPVPITVAVAGLHCQACVDELKTDLGKLPGVSKLIVTLKPGQVTATLDEKRTSASAFVRAIATHPQAMDPEKTYGAKLVAYVDTDACADQQTMCDDCFTELPKTLEDVTGIDTVTLDTTGKIATISFKEDAAVTTQDITTALRKSDLQFHVQYTAPKSTSRNGDATAHQHDQSNGGGMAGCH